MKVTKRVIHKKIYQIDWKIVNKLLIYGCKGSEVAAYFNVPAQDFYNRCLEETGLPLGNYKAMLFRNGNCLLRKKQFEVAMEGDKQMLIWLGKQRLGQKENPNIAEEVPVAIKSFMDVIKKQCSPNMKQNQHEYEHTLYESEFQEDE